MEQCKCSGSLVEVTKRELVANISQLEIGIGTHIPGSSIEIRRDSSSTGSHWSGFRMARKKVTTGGGHVTAHCMRRILICKLATVVLLASLQIANGVAIPEAHKLYIVALHA